MHPSLLADPSPFLANAQRATAEHSDKVSRLSLRRFCVLAGAWNKWPSPASPANVAASHIIAGANAKDRGERAAPLPTCRKGSFPKRDAGYPLAPTRLRFMHLFMRSYKSPPTLKRALLRAAGLKRVKRLPRQPFKLLDPLWS